MYTLIRRLPGSKLIEQQLPAIVASLLIAETFYKFHSFLLECLAFLATWFVLDWVATTLAGLLHPRRRHDGDG
ncbi:MAG TPA: hypothetical protein VFU54_02460 [Actinomycetota bacterium]|jgi:hypothetical protein|nr:hypothetical protein [Actinomycetota bacterium]